MNADEIRELFARHEVPLSKKDVWIVQGNPVVHHAALERLAGNLGIKFNDPVMVRVERDEAVVMVRGFFGNKTDWSFGEAAIGQNYKVSGKQAAYPFAMAEKRAKDRVIVKLAGMHGAYSDEEAEDFRDGRPTDNGDEPPAAPPIELPDMRRAAKPAQRQPASHVPRGQAQAVVADPAAAASNSITAQEKMDRAVALHDARKRAEAAAEVTEPIRPWAEVLAEIQGHLDGARTIDDVSEIRALYADEEAMLSRSDRETFDYAFEQAENRVSKPVEPVEAPEAAKAPAAAEAPQAGNVETWETYSADLMARVDACKTADDVAALRLEWAATKPKRVAFERAEQVTVSQLRTFARKLGDLFLNFEAPKADHASAAAPVAPGLSAITAGASETVRACGERIFSALSTAPTKEKAFVIWSRSQRDRDECGASAEVLAAWDKEYREIRKRLPEEA